MDAEQPAAMDEAQADGYYGDDDMGTEELDLSFLDEEDDDAKHEAESGEPGPAQK